MLARRSSGSTAAAYSAGGDHRPPLVGDAEPAAQIDVLERNAVVSQLQGQRRQRRGGATQRFGRRDLRADVNVHADEPEARDAAPLAIDGARVLQRDAELVAAQSGRDIRMALRVDVRVHAQRDARHAAGGPRASGDAIELAGGLRVDRAHVLRDRVLQLVTRSCRRR